MLIAICPLSPKAAVATAAVKMISRRVVVRIAITPNSLLFFQCDPARLKDLTIRQSKTSNARSPHAPKSHHNARTSGSCRSLRLRTRTRLKIFSQTQELAPRRKIYFSFVQARSSVVQPFVFLGAPMAFSNALFQHRSLLRSNVHSPTFNFGAFANPDCGIARRTPCFPQGHM
jgi:hypothetical protein